MEMSLGGKGTCWICSEPATTEVSFEVNGGRSTVFMCNEHANAKEYVPSKEDKVLDTLECGHCGSLEDLFLVVFPYAKGNAERHLCNACINEILAWI